jgi:low temperature requirement protein LtrA
LDSMDGGSGHPRSTVPTLDHMSTWIELFYDLIFVAAILIFSAAVSHIHPSSDGTWIILVFAASWWVWFTTTVCANRFHMSDFPHRLLLLFQMLVIVLMAIEARVSVTGDSTYLALEYGLLLLTIAIMYFRASRRSGADQAYAGQMAMLYTVIGVVFVVATFLPETARLVVSGVALTLLVVPSIWLLRRMQDFSDADERHIIERMGAFTLIVCGESFVEIALTVSGAVITRVDVFSLVFEFALVFAIFTAYFEDIPAAGLDQHRFAWWAILHLVAQICIAATAVSASKLIGLSISHRLPDAEIIRLTVPLALFYVALAGIGACTRSRPTGPLAVFRLATAAAVAWVGVAAWWIPWIHMEEALPLLTVVAIIHALILVRVRRTTRVVGSDIATG